MTIILSLIISDNGHKDVDIFRSVEVNDDIQLPSEIVINITKQ